MRKSLSISVAWYSAGNIFIRAASFLLLPLYSNLIKPSDFGIYSVIMSFYAVASVLFQGGLQSALTKYYIEREEKNEIFSVIMNIVIAWGAMLLLAVLIFAPYFSELLLDNENYTGLIRLITISLYFETIAFFILHLFKTKEQASKAVLYSTAGAIVNIILNLLLVYYYNQGIEGIIIAQLFSSLVTFVILIPYFRTNYKFDLQRFFKTSFFKPLLFFSLPVFISGLFSSFVDVADRFIINSFLGEYETGIYSFAYRMALIMNVFVIAFRTAFTPYSINLYNSKDYPEKLGKVLLNLLASGGMIILAVSLLSDDLFKLKILGYNLFTTEYQYGIIILPYIIAGYFFSAIMSFYSIYPYVSGKSFHFLWADAVAFLVNIVMNFILIPAVGITGAALSTFFAFLAGAVYLYTISSGRIKIIYRKREMFFISFSALIFLFSGLYFDNFISDIVLLILYVIVVLLLGGVSVNFLSLKSVYKAD